MKNEYVNTSQNRRGGFMGPNQEKGTSNRCASCGSVRHFIKTCAVCFQSTCAVCLRAGKGICPTDYSSLSGDNQVSWDLLRIKTQRASHIILLISGIFVLLILALLFIFTFPF